jgi:hypothetical protein
LREIGIRIGKRRGRLKRIEKGRRKKAGGLDSDKVLT